MKDKFGIEIKCENCNYANDSRICYDHKESGDCVNLKAFFASRKALEARIRELEAENKILADDLAKANDDCLKCEHGDPAALVKPLFVEDYVGKDSFRAYIDDSKNYYFKICTDNYQTDIYFVVKSSGKINSMMVFCGVKMLNRAAIEWCQNKVCDLVRAACGYHSSREDTQK